MKKYLFILLSLTLFLSACNDNEPNKDNDNDAVDVGENSEEATEGAAPKPDDESNESAEDALNETEEIADDPLAGVVNFFEGEGYSIGEESMKAAEIIGAVEGFGIELNGSIIELYLYEADSPDLQEIKDTGEYNMDGFALPSVANGNIVLLGYGEHPEKDNIIETFNSY